MDLLHLAGVFRIGEVGHDLDVFERGWVNQELLISSIVEHGPHLTSLPSEGDVVDGSWKSCICVGDLCLAEHLEAMVGAVCYCYLQIVERVVIWSIYCA